MLTAAGFDEAVTVSLVTDAWSEAFSPWTQEPPLASETPILRGANRLRRSLIPSLLDARRTNESLDKTFGLVIFEADDEAAARRFMEGDPAVKAGVMLATLHPYAVALKR